MNIISIRRALIATSDQVIKLQQRRQRAKDKPRWDAKNGDKLATAVRHQTRLVGLLMTHLTEQGQFDHAGWRNTPEAESEYYG